MKKEMDWIQKDRAAAKKQAVAFGLSWVESALRDYVEPERAGTSKGDAIGFSGGKMKAAMLSILHPALPLREIARAADVKETVLRVWRTQKDFIDAEMKAKSEFGWLYANTIEISVVRDMLLHWNKNPKIKTWTAEFGKLVVCHILKSTFHHPWVQGHLEKLKSQHGDKLKVIVLDDSEEFFDRPVLGVKELANTENLIRYFGRMAPFFNLIAMLPTLQMVNERSDWVTPYFTSFWYNYQWYERVKSQRDRKKFSDWMKRGGYDPKEAVLNMVDFVSDRQSWEDYGEEYMRRYVGSLKSIIVSLFKT